MKNDTCNCVIQLDKNVVIFLKEFLKLKIIKYLRITCAFVFNIIINYFSFVNISVNDRKIDGRTFVLAYCCAEAFPHARLSIHHRYILFAENQSLPISSLE